METKEKASSHKNLAPVLLFGRWWLRLCIFLMLLTFIW